MNVINLNFLGINENVFTGSDGLEHKTYEILALYNNMSVLHFRCVDPSKFDFKSACTPNKEFGFNFELRYESLEVNSAAGKAYRKIIPTYLITGLANNDKDFVSMTDAKL